MTPWLASTRIAVLLMTSRFIASTPTIEWRESIRDDPHIHALESGSAVANDANYRTSAVNESLWLSSTQEYGVADLSTHAPVGAMDEADVPLENLPSDDKFFPPKVIVDAGGLDLSVSESEHGGRQHRHKTAKTEIFKTPIQGGDTGHNEQKEGTPMNPKRTNWHVRGSSVPTAPISLAPTLSSPATTP
jgi:hypothetical protein